LTLIKKGAKGLKIVDIQSRLRLLGFDLGKTEIDGIFGEETENAIKEFQKKRCISVTGVIDDECWQELVDAGYKIGDRLLYLKEPPFRGDDVKTLQFWLKSLGFFKHNEHGIFDKNTSKALIEFQKNMKLRMDGIFGGETLEHLIGLKRIINEKQSSNYPVFKKRKTEKENPARIIIDFGEFPSDMKDEMRKMLRQKIEICFNIVNYCVESLKNANISVILTSDRPGSVLTKLFSRIKKANKSNGDMLVSINIGYDENEAENIFKCYYFQGMKSFSRGGKKLADFLCKEFETVFPNIVTKSSGASYAVLKDTNMTSVYLEVGNINNPGQALLFEEKEYQKKIGDCIVNAVLKYIKEIL